MAVARGMTTFIDNFDRAHALTTTPTMNGWTIEATGSTPTYLAITENGGAMALTLTSTSEAQRAGMFQNDVLQYDIRELQSMWWIAKVAAIGSNSVAVFGLGNARNNDEDAIAVSAWFKMEGATSTTAIVVETDDATNDNNDVATGETLAAVYKKMLIDFTNGLSDVRFFMDGARVAAGTTFDMSDVAAGQNVQPLALNYKASSADVPVLTIAQFGVTYKWAYGA